MKSFYHPNIRVKSPFENRKENNLIKNFALRKKIPTYLGETTIQFYPQNKYVKNNPYPYSSFMKYIRSTQQTENEKFTSFYNKFDKTKLFPLVSRQNLIKFIKQKGSPQQRSLPAISGRSFGKKLKVINKYKIPTLTRNQSSDIRHRIINFNTDDKNRSVNLNELHPIEEKKNERYEECEKNSEFVTDDRRKKILSLKNFNAIFYKPKKKTNFRKVQIFNNFKPFLVDEFREYALL